MEKAFNMNMDANGKVKPVDVVLDCDEVLAFITPLWVKLIHDREEVFGRYFKLFKEGFSFDNHSLKVVMRDRYYLNEWLIRDDIVLDNYTRDILVKELMDVYDRPDFYEYIAPSRFGLGFAQMATQSFINKIYIITKSTANNRESKNRFLETLFSNTMDKIQIIHLELNQKKSDVVKTLGDNIKIIAEDELGNIEDYIENCPNLGKCDLYIPSFGYNQPTKELVQKAEDKGINLMYYDFKWLGDLNDRV